MKFPGSGNQLVSISERFLKGSLCSLFFWYFYPLPRRKNAWVDENSVAFWFKMVFIYLTECNPLPIQDDHPAVSVIRSGDPQVKIPSPNCLNIPLETLKVFSFRLLRCGTWKKFVNQQEEVCWLLQDTVAWAIALWLKYYFFN